MAAGLLQGLLENGIKVPDDISIVGYDDSDVATVITPQLTTVHIPFYEMGYKCADEFIKYVRNENDHFEIFMQPEIIIRKSSGPAKSVASAPDKTDTKDKRGKSSKNETCKPSNIKNIGNISKK